MVQHVSYMNRLNDITESRAVIAAILNLASDFH